MARGYGMRVGPSTPSRPSARSSVPYGAKTRLTSCIASLTFSWPMITVTPPRRLSTGTSCSRKSERCRTSSTPRSLAPPANSGCSRTLTMPSVKTSSTATRVGLLEHLGDAPRRRARRAGSACATRRRTWGADRPASSRVERGRGRRRAPPGRSLSPAVARSTLPRGRGDAARRCRRRAPAPPGAPGRASSTSWTWPNRRAARPCRGDDRGGAGAGGEDRGGQPQPLVAGQLHLAELVADHELVGAVEGRLAHQRLDVDPIAQVRRDASGAGVRVAQQAQRLELGHGAAHGRRADAAGRSGRRAPASRPGRRSGRSPRRRRAARCAAARSARAPTETGRSARVAGHPLADQIDLRLVLVR